MRNYRYLIATFIIVALLVLGFLWLVRPKSTTTKPTTTTKTNNLSDYADNGATVSYINEGITDSDQNHRLIKISVSQNLVSIEIIAGYQGKIIKSESFANNQNAFSEFLAGLQNLGYTKSRKINSNVTLQGQCPLGNKYVSKNYNIGGFSTELWSTSCSGVRGNFGGNLAQVQQMFKKQVPNYSQFTSGVNLN